MALRIPISIIFIAHGAQKLFGAFGGLALLLASTTLLVSGAGRLSLDAVLTEHRTPRLAPTY